MIPNLIRIAMFLMGLGRQSIQKQAERPCNALCPRGGYEDYPSKESKR